MGRDLDLQPNLTSDLLRLRPLRSEDYPALFAVASDPLVWAQHPANDRYQATVFKAFFDDALASGGALIAIDAKLGAVIGSSRYYAYSAEQRTVEIGWTFLAREYWGGAHNGDMKRLMLTHAFQFVDKVFFFVGINNLRSQKAVEKIGGVQIGTRNNATTGTDLKFELSETTYQAALGRTAPIG